MIGPEMFGEFVEPELEASCERLGRAFYHMDGPGQLSHLDLLIRADGLDGIQWVPGAGAPGCEHWPDVYRKIHKAGKKIQIVDGGFQTIDAVAAQIGTKAGLQHAVFRRPIEEEGIARRELARYGIE